MSQEHDIFSRLIDALASAESAANQLSALQADRRDIWLTVGGLIRKVREKILDVAMKGQRPQ
jgi:hypothetical protein